MERKPLLSETERLEIINRLLDTEAGLLFFRWLCLEVCGYNVTSIAYENGAVSSNATLFNEARKDIWRLLRPYILHEQLVKIESFDVFLTQELLRSYKHNTTQEEEETM